MSSRDAKRSRKGHHKSGHQSHRGTERQSPHKQHSLPAVDESNPVIQQFRVFQQHLDARHDKHERIVKISRDITIESKRTIFLLHRLDTSRSQQILEEAEAKLSELCHSKWLMVARELQGEDHYQFLRAYSPGLQEYIEALSMLYYLKEKSLIPLSHVENSLKFTVDASKCNVPSSDKREKADEGSSVQNIHNTESLHSSDTISLESQTMDTEGTNDKMEMAVHVPPIEYMLGIADLSGELMRMAIHSVGMGELSFTFDLCEVIRVIHDAFLTFGNVHRELPRKFSTLKQSLKKVETACYTLQIRGSEIPKHMLADVFSNQATIDNVGYDEEHDN